MIDAETAVIAAAAAFFAGLVRGFAGFGAALILMPALSALTAPQIAVPVLQLVDTTTTLPLAVRAWPKSAPRELTPLFIGYALALPFGLLILVYADPAHLTDAIAVFVLAVAMLIAAGYRRTTAPGAALTMAVGAAAGGCSGAVGIGGPPVVLFWLSGQDAAARVRANIMVFFTGTGFLAMAGLAVAGLWTLEVLLWSLILGPVYAGGLWVGAKLFRPGHEVLYRRVALGLVTAVGLATLLGG